MPDEAAIFRSTTARILVLDTFCCDAWNSANEGPWKSQLGLMCLVLRVRGMAMIGEGCRRHCCNSWFESCGSTQSSYRLDSYGAIFEWGNRGMRSCRLVNCLGHSVHVNYSPSVVAIG